MKRASQYAVVLTTSPDLGVAQALAKAALSERLVACANLIPKLESHYWWQGRIESRTEVLVIFKTTKAKVKALEKLVLEKHPYDIPEFIVLPISAGSKPYLDWVSRSVTGC